MLPFGITDFICMWACFILLYKICIVGNIAVSNADVYSVDLEPK